MMQESQERLVISRDSKMPAVNKLVELADSKPYCLGSTVRLRLVPLCGCHGTRAKGYQHFQTFVADATQHYSQSIG